jgi:PTS system mannose-specific IIC component
VPIPPLPILLLLGGIAALDGTSVGQMMVSRPLVAATVAGWVLGDPVAGLLVGGMLEVLYLGVLPVGGVRFPETGPAGVVAGAAAASMGTPGAIPLALLLGIVVAELGAVSITAIRKVNGHFAPDPEVDPVDARRLERVHRALVLLDGARGMALTFVGLALGRFALGVLAPAWPLDQSSTALLLGLGLMVPGGALLASLGRRRIALPLFLAGLAAGALLA